MNREVYENQTHRSDNRAGRPSPDPRGQNPNRTDTEHPTRNPDGTFAADSELRGPTARATEEKVAAPRRRRRTEREFLRLLIGEFGAEDLRAIARSVKGRAMAGDRDALAFVGRYMFGNGRISLDELAHPPLIRKSRR